MSSSAGKKGNCFLPPPHPRATWSGGQTILGGCGGEGSGRLGRFQGSLGLWDFVDTTPDSISELTCSKMSSMPPGIGVGAS